MNSLPKMPDPHLVKHPVFVDLDSVLKYETVKSWYGSRIGDGRKTALYHFAAPKGTGWKACSKDALNPRH